MTLPGEIRNVLIISGHSLFRLGLSSLLRHRAGSNLERLETASSLEEAENVLDNLSPDLVVLDYDDNELDREEFLYSFNASQSMPRLVLLSLHEPPGQSQAYDFHTMAASELEKWLV